jgi:hypothetical protein
VIFSWQTETKPPLNQIVLVAIAQPEELTGPGDEPTPVWVGYWDGTVWNSDQADEIQVIAWMDLPLPPRPFQDGEFHVESFRVPDVGTFYSVKCGEQILAIRADREKAQQLAQALKVEET